MDQAPTGRRPRLGHKRVALMDWEEIVVGRRYVDLASGALLVVTRVTRSRVWIEGRDKSIDIWDFRLRAMPSGRTTASPED